MPEVEPSQSPYPSKPYESMADVVADKGRYGDSMMMHVNPLEVAALDEMVPGGLPRNPETGQPEAFLFLLPMLGGMLSAGGAALASGIAGLGAAGTAGGALASGLGTALGAIPSLAGSALTGLGTAASSALGGSTLGSALTTVPKGLMGMLPSKVAAAIPSSLGGAGTGVVGSIGKTATAVGQNLASGNFGNAISGLGQGLGQVAGLPLEAAGSLMGTHTGSGGLGSFLPESVLGTGGEGGGGGAPPDPSGLSADPSVVQPEAVTSSPAVDPTGGRNALDVVTDATGEVTETGSHAGDVVVDTAAEGGWTTGEKIGAGLLGAQFLDYVIPQDDDDPYGGKSSYEGESSWSGRTYSGGTGGGRSGERSYYTGRVG